MNEYMQHLSILLTTYPEAFFHKGGGEYELLETALNLRKLGFIADVYSPYSNVLESYNTIIHFSIHKSGLSTVKAIKAAGKRLILWPNFWTCQRAQSNDVVAQQFLEMADVVIFKSVTEKNNFELITSLENSQTLIVPTGVESIFADPTPKTLFRDTFGIDEYLVWVGIFEPRKNQLEVIRALRELDVPIVFIGNFREEAYYQACREAAPSHFIFLKPMEHRSDILRAAIRESRLYIEPTLDPAGKSALEAAICGTRVLVSEALWEREHLGDFAVYVNPTDHESLREGVRRGLTTSPHPDQVPILSQKHLLPNTLNKLAILLRGTE